ncbi:MAG: ABC transporter permease [Patescibacteria group bacterium]|nr:MAG: ABC transporter permease [Patescibacteria group bacterium]
MHKTFRKFQELLFNIRRVMALGFQIAPHEISWYYLTAFVGGVSPVLAAFLLKIFLDSLASSNSLTNIPIIILASLLGYYFIRLLETVLYWGLNTAYYDYLLRNKMQAGLTYRYAQKISSLDTAHLENPEVQNLITKLESTFQWQIPDFLRIWSYVFSSLLTILVSSIALAPYGWWIPIVLLLVSLPRFYLKLKHGQFVWAMYGGSAPEAKKLWYINSLLTDQESVMETRIFQSQPALLKKFEALQDHLFRLNKKPLDRYRWVLIFAPILETAVALAIVYLFIPQVLTGALTIGSIAFLITTLESLRNGMSWCASQVGELYEKNLFINPYFELMTLPQLIKEPRRAHSFKKIEPPHIEFRNVSFAYPGGPSILKQVSFTIQPGENVALVGINGAGKTTIIKLLCRFYDVTEGEILINGINLRELKLSNWYSHLGTLFQNFVQYNFTVRENIMLGAPNIRDQKRMHQAAVDSGAWEFIQRLPKQYDQMLGRRFEDGYELSGGQWQKLAIARAFYEKAPVLILDEPTSAIDAEAEFEIFNNLEKIYHDKTVILVSHRFSTVRNAQKIIVLEQGHILEQGSHIELLAQNGKYATMFITQAKGYM